MLIPVSLTFLNNYFYYFEMSDFKDHKYKATNFELLDDLREQGHQLGERREDVLDSLLNLILNHKKEIQKVPGTATYEAAKNWCKKRPGSGFRADEQDLGGGPDKEVVIFDKAGKPFIVNGYKLKPSDYGMRKFYQEAVDKDPERMIGTSMREWATEQVWASVPEKGNKWNHTITKNTPVYDRLHSWGYRMPAKPKKEASPYAIFSKEIARIVKDVLMEGEIYVRLGSVFGIPAKPNMQNLDFFNKIVSPISIYRFLYLRLVEQKYFWACASSQQTKNINTFERFKHFLKERKATFRNWFLTYVMTGTEKEKFKDSWVGKESVLDALVKESIQLDGSDIQDGIVFLISVANLKDKTPVEFTFKGEAVSTTFRELLVDGETAGKFNTVIKESYSRNPTSRDLKKRLNRWKKNAEESMKSYFKSAEAQKLFFENQEGMNAFLKGVAMGLPNATDEKSAMRQRQEASSPAKRPEVEVVPERGEVGGDDDEGDDDEGDRIPALSKGQRKMTEYFPQAD